MKFSKHLAVVAVAIWATLTPIVTSAGPAVIRDAELEDIIQGYMTPLLQVAGIAPGDVRLILINQPDINAFVAGGMNIFVYTGLLRKAETPDEVIGVLAHEIGHIAGGHIARLGSALENASTQAIASAILGVAAAIASGRTDVGAAVTAGGQSSALRGVLAHTRTQESAADQ
ncbi:MAG: M48 family metalloprotease, partial [Rhodospirillales bacterium]